MTTKPQTNGSAIQKQLLEIAEKACLVSKDSSEFVGLHDEIKQLQSADKDEALALEAVLVSFTGDFDGSANLLEQRTRKNRFDDLAIYTNLYRCSEAHQIYKNYFGPASGNFSRAAGAGWTMGAFRQVAAFAKEAQRMNLSNLDLLPMEKIMEIDRLFEEFGISDEVTADLIAIAGKALLNHGVMHLGDAPMVDVFDYPGELRAVHVKYRVPLSAAEAVQAYMEFLEDIVVADKSIPAGLNISFEGVHA